MPGMPVLFHDRSQVKRAKPRAIEGCCGRQSKQKPPTQGRAGEVSINPFEGSIERKKTQFTNQEITMRDLAHQ
jgi:hypothetical protein